jgi:hypothetical protein
MQKFVKESSDFFFEFHNLVFMIHNNLFQFMKLFQFYHALVHISGKKQEHGTEPACLELPNAVSPPGAG